MARAERRLVLFPPCCSLKAVGVAFGLTLTLGSSLSAQGTLPPVGRKPGQPLPASAYPHTAYPATANPQVARGVPQPNVPVQQAIPHGMAAAPMQTAAQPMGAGGYAPTASYPVAQATAQVYPNGQPYPSGQPYANGQPYVNGQPYANGQPYVGGQPQAQATMPPQTAGMMQGGRYAWPSPQAAAMAQATPQMTTHGFAVSQAPQSAPQRPAAAAQMMPPMGRAPHMTRAPQMMGPQMTPGNYGPPSTMMPQRPPMQTAMRPPASMPRQQPMPRQQAMPRQQPMPVAQNQPQPGAATGSSVEAARQFERQGNVAGAEAQYRAMLSQNPTDRSVLVSYARMKHRIGQLPESVQIYQTALQHYPNDPVILNDLGLCFARMGDLPNAITTLRASVGLRPDSQRYRNNLAIVLLEMNRAEEAHAVLAEVHGDILAKYNVSVMLSRRGKTDEARQMLTAIVEAHPEFGPARTMLGELGPGTQPVARVASLPASTGGATPRATVSQETTASPKLNLIEPQSAQLEVGRGSVAAPAVFHGELPPEVGSYPIPGVGLEAGQ